MSGSAFDQTALLELIREFGFPVYGAADITAIRDEFLLPDRIRVKYPRAISLGVGVLGPVLEEIESQPTQLYLHHYRQLNFFLDRGALFIATQLVQAGFQAIPIAASQLIDWENQRGHVSHKKIALLAGNGWIGRNNLLVHPCLGSRLRLVSILTDMPLEAGKPLEFGCGACRACLAPCPAGAIRENPADFDHRGCYAKLDEFRRSHIVSQHICGVCVKACRGPALPK